MQDHVSLLILSGSSLTALGLLSWVGLKAWREWIALQQQGLRAMPTGDPSPVGARIELADLRERIRKLEDIATGVDLLP